MDTDTKYNRSEYQWELHEKYWGRSTVPGVQHGRYKSAWVRERKTGSAAKKNITGTGIEPDRYIKKILGDNVIGGLTRYSDSGPD